MDEAVSIWAEADTVVQSRAGAEAARNLVTGPFVTCCGDADGDGEFRGDTMIGLLPGEGGQVGLVRAPATPCVERDVLGGSWPYPAARWEDVRSRLARWREADNTFPALPSHPSASSGGRALALGSTSMEASHEYARHARLHLTITMEAVAICPSS